MGTHNSYHVAPPTSVITFLNSPIVTGLLGSDADEVPGAWEVTMQPLGQQLGSYGALSLPACVCRAFAGPCCAVTSGRWCLDAEQAYHLHRLRWRSVRQSGSGK